MVKSNTVENTDAETYRERQNQNCPEFDPEYGPGNHSYTYKLPDDSEVAVRAECTGCGEFLGEWDSRDKAAESTGEMDIGECPHCNESAWVNQGGGRTVDGDVWHESCWYISKYDGFEPTGGDAPIANNPDRPFNLHRTVETEIAGEIFQWDEYLYTPLYQDHGRHNLPTRDELSVRQLETLREWVTEENPTDTGKVHERDFPVGVFPARFVLIGGYDRKLPDKWICPDCGEIVEPKRSVQVYEGDPDVTSERIDIQAECENCGSDRWLTAGEPIEESAQDAFSPLSQRERQVVKLDIIGMHTDEDMAEALDIEPSSVREYRTRAREKAKRGKRLHDKLEAFGVIDA